MGDETKGPDETHFELLIDSGQQILRLLTAEEAIGPTHIAIIRRWIEHAADFIGPVMPPKSPEYESLKDIRRAYEQVTHILPGNPSEDIIKVLSGLRRARKRFVACCESAFSRVHPAERTRACHAVLNETWQFIRDNLIEMLKGKENGRTKRTAMLHSYGRMYSWVQSMVTLGNRHGGQTAIVEHVFALAGCLRAVFELLLDVNLLAQEKVENASEKFFSFEKVARHKVANNSLALHQQYAHLTKEQVKMYGASGEAIKAEIDESVVALWGRTKKDKPNRPDHWTGMTVVERARTLGGDCIRYYQHSYHYCNWCLHSGYIDVLAANEDVAWLVCAHSYSYANVMLLASTRILIGELDEALDVEGLSEGLQNAQLRGACILWDMAVNGSTQ